MSTVVHKVEGKRLVGKVLLMNLCFLTWLQCMLNVSRLLFVSRLHQVSGGFLLTVIQCEAYSKVQFFV